jgi:hypothetical protein
VLFVDQDLKNPAMILFLNKLDLFAQKVAFQHSKIKPHFPDFPEELEGNVDEAKEFIADMFRARNRRGTSTNPLFFFCFFFSVFFFFFLLSYHLVHVCALCLLQ